MKAIETRAEQFAHRLEAISAKAAAIYRKCYVSTADTALKLLPDGTSFVLTGDIPAMWLRDSAAQVNHYIPLASDSEVGAAIRGVIRRQLRYIKLDPYANAFNEEPNGNGWSTDLPKPSPWVWERKYEVDSLCYPIKLLYRYWKATGDRSFAEAELPSVMEVILRVWRTEQRHPEQSDYTFARMSDVPGVLEECKCHNVGYTGMIWSAFRPSDDFCTYGYLVPSNMFACVVLGYAAEMLGGSHPLTAEIERLKSEIEQGIEAYGTVEHPKYGRMYAYEVDGLGNSIVCDDANIPSLLAVPYIGYRGCDDETYLNTRRYILSRDNPYYFEGRYARGVGSPHTPKDHIWHMGLIMQALTAESRAEQEELLAMLLSTDAGTDCMHESFHCDDPAVFTRAWFTWPNALVCELLEMMYE